MTSVTEWFQALFNALGISKPPLALLFLFCCSLTISIVFGYIVKKMLESTAEKYLQAQILEYEDEKNRAIAKQNPHLWIKALYNENNLKNFKQSTYLQKLLPQLIVGLIYIFIFTSLRQIIGDQTLNATPDTGMIVSVLPFQFSSQIPIFGSWFSATVYNPTLSAAGFGTMYLLAAVASSIFVRSFLGLNPNPNVTKSSPT